ncbi:hypothetical protein AB6A63_01995, partial ['Camptotheca acuminata' phytoplasma]
MNINNITEFFKNKKFFYYLIIYLILFQILEHYLFYSIYSKSKQNILWAKILNNLINFNKLTIKIIISIYPIIFSFYILNNIEKSSDKLNTNPKISSKQKSLFTLKDVAGNKEEKEEMKELIDFLNNPHKYQKMGAVI